MKSLPHFHLIPMAEIREKVDRNAVLSDCTLVEFTRAIQKHPIPLILEQQKLLSPIALVAAIVGDDSALAIDITPLSQEQRLAFAHAFYRYLLTLGVTDKVLQLVCEPLLHTGLLQDDPTLDSIALGNMIMDNAWKHFSNRIEHNGQKHNAKRECSCSDGGCDG